MEKNTDFSFVSANGMVFLENPGFETENADGMVNTNSIPQSLDTENETIHQKF